MRPHVATTRRGSILIMTVIMMAGFLVVAVEFAMFTISGIRQARQFDNAAVAYYSAESGTESALYQVRKEFSDTDMALFRTKAADTKVNATSATVSDVVWDLSRTGAALNTAPCVLSPLPGQGFFNTCIDQANYDRMAQEQPLELALYTNGGNTAIGAKTLTLTSKTDDCGANTPWAELTTSSWPTGMDWGSAEVTKAFQPMSVLGTDGLSRSISFNMAIEAKPAAVRLKIYHCSLHNVSITLTNDAGAVPIPNYFIIQPSASTVAGGNQRTQATMPRRTPSSGLYDFVVFSESQIAK